MKRPRVPGTESEKTEQADLPSVSDDPIYEASISELIAEYQEDGDFDEDGRLTNFKDGPLTPEDLKTGKTGGRWNVANGGAPVEAFIYTRDKREWVRISGTEYAFITHCEYLGTLHSDEYLEEALDEIEAQTGRRPLVREMPSDEEIEMAKEMLAAEVAEAVSS